MVTYDELIQKKIDETIQPLLQNVAKEWATIIVKIPLEDQDNFILKVKKLITVFIKTEFYKSLSQKNIYDNEKDTLHLNQKQKYQEISLDLLRFIRKIKLS